MKRVLIKVSGEALSSANQPVCFEISASFGKLPQFDDNRTEKLNRLLQYFSLNGVLDPFDSRTSLAIGGKELFTLSETEYHGKKTRILSAGGQAYAIPEDPEQPASESAETRTLSEDASRQYRILSSMKAYASFFSSLPALFPEKAGIYPGHSRCLQKP